MISDALPSFALGYDDARSRPYGPAAAQCETIHFAWHARAHLPARYCDGWARVCRLHLGCQSRHMSGAEAQTLAFLTLVFGQLWHVFDARSTRTLFARNPFENYQLLLAVAFQRKTV